MTWIFDLDIVNLKQNNLLKKEGKLSKYLAAINLNLNGLSNGSTKNTNIIICSTRHGCTGKQAWQAITVVTI